MASAPSPSGTKSFTGRMIRSKADLTYYIERDKERNIGDIDFLSFWMKRIYKTDGMIAYLYLVSLRKYEYALNCLYKKGLWGKIVTLYYKWVHHRKSIKYNIVIGPNMVGYGLRIAHVIGGGIIVNCKSMGNNCVVNVNVVVGNKHKTTDVPTIGDNVSLSTGCKVFGLIEIGNNVVVAPNAVVVKDVPDNCIVGGVPARVINKRL